MKALIIIFIFLIGCSSGFNYDILINEYTIQEGTGKIKQNIKELNIEIQDFDSLNIIYNWISDFSSKNCLSNRIKEPENYTRNLLLKGTFAEWLRYIPIKEGNPPVLLYNGEKKWNQSVHESVIDLDVGTRDLQQCADAVIRLRSEYLYSTKKLDSIHFNYTSGAEISFSKWSSGYKSSPLRGSGVNWSSCNICNTSYESFRKYLTHIFNYAGTLSLSKELRSKELSNIQSGDVIIKGGSPGHAVLVMDIAVNNLGEKIFLLAQSYMPAQEMHILKNLNNLEISPWYELNEIKNVIETPEWNFDRSSLKEW